MRAISEYAKIRPRRTPPAQTELLVADSTRISVEILGQRLTLKGISDPAYAQRLAALVDSRMRAIKAGSTLDYHKVALLTALNLADELLQTKDRLDGLSSDTEKDARRLTALVDAVIS